MLSPVESQVAMEGKISCERIGISMGRYWVRALGYEVVTTYEPDEVSDTRAGTSATGRRIVWEGCGVPSRNFRSMTRTTNGWSRQSRSAWVNSIARPTL